MPLTCPQPLWGCLGWEELCPFARGWVSAEDLTSPSAVSCDSRMSVFCLLACSFPVRVPGSRLLSLPGQEMEEQGSSQEVCSGVCVNKGIQPVPFPLGAWPQGVGCCGLPQARSLSTILSLRALRITLATVGRPCKKLEIVLVTVHGQRKASFLCPSESWVTTLSSLKLNHAFANIIFITEFSTELFSSQLKPCLFFLLIINFWLSLKMERTGHSKLPGKHLLFILPWAPLYLLSLEPCSVASGKPEALFPRALCASYCLVTLKVRDVIATFH